ncbi:MAG: hypothetical protein QNJ58_13910 [Desulfobacterales bacterium]|nr:hypothetical protein [Desulfobacterales bacterium]
MPDAELGEDFGMDMSVIEDGHNTLSGFESSVKDFQSWVPKFEEAIDL